jgi:hypothetical protein
MTANAATLAREHRSLPNELRPIARDHPNRAVIFNEICSDIGRITGERP